jgi:hypothetical protein
MRGHSGYVLVDNKGEDVKVESEKKVLPMTAPLQIKRMGRPRKLMAAT